MLPDSAQSLIIRTFHLHLVCYANGSCNFLYVMPYPLLRRLQIVIMNQLEKAMENGNEYRQDAFGKGSCVNR